jgi:hypothetical protein
MRQKRRENSRRKLRAVNVHGGKQREKIKSN